MIQLIAFLLASAGIVWFSRHSLRDPHTHGFFRFFAFESILALILLNAERWFREPFSPWQIVSWLLLAVSLLLALDGFYLLRVSGKPRGNIENTTHLVRIGVYRFIRHPLYSSLLFLAWGAFLKDPSPLGGVLVVMGTAAMMATAKVEEGEVLARFGADYAAYMKTTRMFVPFLF